MSLEVEVLESEESNSRKMEISKKVATKGRPTTVKELFGTGLLEGYPVFYNGGKRRFPLRGSIKDTGILCFCTPCKGVRVVPPCQFEIHACKSQRRASQYICLENGKSLLDVVKECRKSSVKTLEETIHKFVGPMSVKESVVCMNCQGTFLAAASEVEPLCDSCMIIENSEIDTECANSRHLELASNLKSPKRSPLQISSRRGQQKIMKISSPHQPVPKFSGSALASHLKSSSDLRANGTMRDINTRKILKKCSNASLSRPLKSGSSHISMKSKSSSKVTKNRRYQTMHRMVFEDGGLPDGTEVAYYSNGKKLRDGYKMGWGIMCRCCRTLVLVLKWCLKCSIFYQIYYFFLPTLSRLVHRSLRLMLVVPRTGNPTCISTRQMGCPSMNSLFPCRKGTSYLQMVGNLCFVMGVPGPSTKMRL